MSATFTPALRAVCAAVAAASGVPEPRQPSEAVDWTEFLRLVHRHDVATEVHRSAWLGDVGAPPEVAAAIRERARRNAMDDLRMMAFHREVFAALAGAGVEGIVLKGVTVAVDAYGDPGARSPGDLDILVRPASVPRAVAALRSTGLDWYDWGDPNRVPVELAPIGSLTRLPVARDVALSRDGLKAELHWRLFLNERLMPVDPDWITAPRLVQVQGTEVPGLPVAAQWTYLLVHGAIHLWSRMKWLADVPALAVRRPELVSVDGLRSTEPGYRRSIAVGLRVAEAAFGRFLDSDARAWASSVGGTRMLLAKSLRYLTSEQDRPTVISPRALPGVVRARLALRRDARYRLDELRQLLILAGRSQDIEDPSVLDLAAGPLRWSQRAARRVVKRDV